MNTISCEPAWISSRKPSGLEPGGKVSGFCLGLSRCRKLKKGGARRRRKGIESGSGLVLEFGLVRDAVRRQGVRHLHEQTARVDLRTEVRCICDRNI